MNHLVPTIHTLATAEQIRDAFAHAWSAVAQTQPTLEGLAVLVAHSAFETGRWSACWNNNPGNIKHVDGDGHDYMYLVADEYVAPETVEHWRTSSLFVREGDKTNSEGRRQIFLRSPFRAFASLDEGVADHISYLHRRQPLAWGCMEAGDPVRYVNALHAGRYFTGDLGVYLHNVVSLHREYLQRWAAIV